MDSMDIQPYVSSSNPDDLGKLSFKHLINKNQVRNTKSHCTPTFIFDTFV